MEYIYGEHLFYGQFERDFYLFLQSRKREQEDELWSISQEGKLKSTLTEIERIIEASCVYTVRNDSISQELLELNAMGIVTTVLSSEVFNNTLEQVMPKKTDTDCEKHPEDHPDVEKESPPSSPPSPPLAPTPLHDDEESDNGTDASCIDGETDSYQLQLDGDFRDELESTFQNTSQLQNSSDDSGNIYGESPGYGNEDAQWIGVLKEVSMCEKEGKVTKLNSDFRNQLNIYLLNPPKPEVFVEPESVSGRMLGQCYINIGAGEVKRGNLDKAHGAFCEALAIGCEEDDKELQWKAHEGLGTVAGLKDDVENSIKSYNAAVYLLDRELSTVEVTTFRNHIIQKLKRME